MVTIQILAAIFAFLFACLTAGCALKTENDGLAHRGTLGSDEVRYVAGLYQAAGLFFIAFCILIK